MDYLNDSTLTALLKTHVPTILAHWVNEMHNIKFNYYESIPINSCKIIIFITRPFSMLWNDAVHYQEIIGK